VLSMFTLHKTTNACRVNQTNWGYSDGQHLNGCIQIGYRLRETLVDTHSKLATLIMAGMIGQGGYLIKSSVEHEPITRSWHELDANTETALTKATLLISEQMRAYDRRLQGLQ
jgi:hypothetical protein